VSRCVAGPMAITNAKRVSRRHLCQYGASVQQEEKRVGGDDTANGWTITLLILGNGIRFVAEIEAERGMVLGARDFYGYIGAAILTFKEGIDGFQEK